MLALIVIMILVIVLGGLASYQMYTINQTQNLVIQSQKNQSAVALWKTMLVSKAKAVGDNNEIVLPLGENKSGYHSLPSWVYFNTKNPWGKDFIYCPFGPISSGTLSTTIPLTSTTNYQARIVSNFATTINGTARDYVVASTPNGISNEILAFIISPIPSASNVLPNCADVVFDSGLNAYRVDNGLVEVISNGDVETFANLARMSGQDDNINSSVRYENIIEGDSSPNGNSLEENLNYINGANYQYAKLTLPAGTHTISSLNLNSGSDSYSEDKKTIILEGDSVSSTIIDSASVSQLLFNNYKVILKDIRITSNVIPIFSESDLKTENVQFSNVMLKKSRWFVNGSNDEILSGNNMPRTDKYGLYMYQSDLYIEQSKKLTINEHSGNVGLMKSELSNILIDGGSLEGNKVNNLEGLILVDSKFKINVGNISINNSAGFNISDILLNENSDINAFNSLITVSGKATGSIINRGKIIFNGTSLITNSGGNYGIVLQRNSSLILKTELSNDIIIGNILPANRPNVAILDYGSEDQYNSAGFVGGSPTNGGSIRIYAMTYCVRGPLFMYSYETKMTGSNQSANDYTGLPESTQLLISKLNSSNWACIKPV